MSALKDRIEQARSLRKARRRLFALEAIAAGALIVAALAVPACQHKQSDVSKPTVKGSTPHGQ